MNFNLTVRRRDVSRVPPLHHRPDDELLEPADELSALAPGTLGVPREGGSRRQLSQNPQLQFGWFAMGASAQARVDAAPTVQD